MGQIPDVRSALALVTAPYPDQPIASEASPTTIEARESPGEHPSPQPRPHGLVNHPTASAIHSRGSPGGYCTPGDNWWVPCGIPLGDPWGSAWGSSPVSPGASRGEYPGAAPWDTSGGPGGYERDTPGGTAGGSPGVLLIYHGANPRCLVGLGPTAPYPGHPIASEASPTTIEARGSLGEHPSPQPRPRGLVNHPTAFGIYSRGYPGGYCTPGDNWGVPSVWDTLG
jgi:hypothetical protein